jgi:hypothetical protein
MVQTAWAGRSFFVDYLRTCSIVHFSGHGKPNCVVLEDTGVYEGLAMMFHTNEDEMTRLQQEIEGKGNDFCRSITGTKYKY